MNDHDQKNLQFLLDASPEQFDDWLNTVSDDDLDYGVELMQKHRSKILMNIVELFDDVQSTEQADAILSKFGK